MKDRSKKIPVQRRYAVIALFLALALWTLWGNTALTISTFTISDSRIPAEFSGFRIIQISDLHNAEFGKNNSALLRKISEAEPDMIAITGDLVDARHTNTEIALDFVREAVQIAPVYYVTGNHEAALPQYDSLKKNLEAAGAAILENETVSLASHSGAVTLIGLSDPNFASHGGDASDMIRETLNYLKTDETAYTILLSHRPELFETYVDCSINLVLSGHAHGGQFRLPFIGGLIAPNQGLFPRYDAGLYTESNTDMIVSRGLGNSIIPLRFNNRPEIILIVLQTEP